MTTDEIANNARHLEAAYGLIGAWVVLVEIYDADTGATVLHKCNGGGSAWTYLGMTQTVTDGYAQQMRRNRT